MSPGRSNDRLHGIGRLGTRIEVVVLVVCLLLAGGIWGFVEIADEVMEGDTRQIDRAVLLSMRSAEDVSDPLGPRWFEEVMRDVTALGGIAILVLFTLAVTGFLLLRGNRGMAVMTLAAVIGGLAASSILKMSFDRPRPDLVPHGSHVLTASFPSSHSMLSAVVFLTLGGLLARHLRRRREKAYVLVLAIGTTALVGISRVYLGVHWPTDVLAGWMAGAAWALLCWFVAYLLQQRGGV